MKFLSTIILSLFFLAACTKKPINKGETILNVSYKQNLSLDIYQPTEEIGLKNPVIIFFHGGGWVDGDKDVVNTGKYIELLDDLRDQGYAIVSVNYRLLNGVSIFPSNVEDCKDAIIWVKNYASKYNFDDQNIGVWGGSAGAHLALLACILPDTLTQGSPSTTVFPNINYIVNFFGPSDLVSLFLLSSRQELENIQLSDPAEYNLAKDRIRNMFNLDIQSDYTQCKNLCQMYSPIQYISSSTPPTIIFHGDKDNTVPVSQSDNLYTELIKNSVYVEYEKIHNVGHNFKGMSNKQEKDIRKKMLSFIKAHTYL